MKKNIKDSCLRVINTSLLIILLTLCGQAIGAESSIESSSGGSDWNWGLLLIVISVVIVMVLSVSMVIFWGKKQDDFNHIVFFCIKHLVKSSSVEEKCEAAKALAYANDPIALLVLIGVVNEPGIEQDMIRKVALESLNTMSTRFIKYQKFIQSLIPALEKNKHEEIIKLLIENFESSSHEKYLQCAYVIAREYVCIEKYQDAREWLEKAQKRESRDNLCTSEISDLIELCNKHQYHNCDEIYQAKEYFHALECYSSITSRLSEHDKHHYLSHLRIACTYCKLERYNDARDATLLALQHHQKTDEALRLNELLHHLLTNETGQSDKVNIANLNQFVDKTMCMHCGERK